MNQRYRHAPMEIRLATSYFERLRGLLFTDPDDLAADALVLVPCSAVHTWLMRYPIDLAFVSKDGQVLKTVMGARPWRARIACAGAAAVLERPSGKASGWPLVGERLMLSAIARPAREHSRDVGGPL